MVREYTAETGTKHIRYLQAGAGWPVVLLHAFPLNADMWRPQLERVPQGWRMIAPDLGGFGRNGAGAPLAGAPLTLDDFAADIDALLDVLEIDSATIGGLSMGGYVTFALFRRSPDRFNGMILADTKAPADSPEGRQARRAMLERLHRGGAAAVADEMLPKLLAPDAPRHDRILNETRRMIESAPVPAIAAAIHAMMSRPDSTEDLARIPCPALVMAGADDVLTPPAEAEAMSRLITRSRLVLLPGAGHLSNIDAPEAFSTALADFLASNL